ncbi:MAG: DedA family protein [Candidatus Micrarchaeaceae archaeon]
MIFSIISSLAQLVSGSASIIAQFIHAYGYAALFIAMALESSSLPVPSEVVMPLAGALAHSGFFNFWFAFLAALAGSILGLAVDYYVGYFIGKDIVYKHLRRFHISKEKLDSFDRWFERNGVAAVFITRLIPVLRTIMSFPAGFSRMDKKQFFTYSIAGAFIWNLVLMLFGFYISTYANNVVILMAGIGVFALLLYVLYREALKRMH